MALLDKNLLQRIVGALVLLALAIIFIPMLLSRQDDMQRVVVDAPSMPQAPAMPEIEMQPVTVPKPQIIDEAPEQQDQGPEPITAITDEPEINPVPATPPPEVREQAKADAAARAEQPVEPAPKPAERLDANSLPVSWSVQLASLSSRSGAENLQKTLRAQGYNAYIRTFEGMNRVFVGPLVERAEADRLRDQLNRKQKLNGFVVRFKPESS
ncbi:MULTISPECIES: SPOR domain-containing protein [Pseudomonas]|uniref:DedD protein n=1 Tax=Pseudomonas segetis TaxID=298908 RepID=A0A239K0H3_9PSED|nr:MULTISPECIES: SPOR domain-containing protein [Pseudomonas]SNT11238.1 DedD protein [Pseudomonas segetis]